MQFLNNVASQNGLCFMMRKRKMHQDAIMLIITEDNQKAIISIISSANLIRLLTPIYSGRLKVVTSKTKLRRGYFHHGIYFTS